MGVSRLSDVFGRSVFQKRHTSFVARVHYQMMQSRDIATRSKKIMDRLRDEQPSNDVLLKINELLPKVINI